MDRESRWVRALDGSEFMPGLVGLNNMRSNDYVNVSVQIMARIVPIRNFFLLPSNYTACKSPLVQRFGELMRKLWNPRNFKGQASTPDICASLTLLGSWNAAVFLAQDRQ